MQINQMNNYEKFDMNYIKDKKFSKIYDSSFYISTL